MWKKLAEEAAAAGEGYRPVDVVIGSDTVRRPQLSGWKLSLPVAAAHTLQLQLASRSCSSHCRHWLIQLRGGERRQAKRAGGRFGWHMLGVVRC